jgi:hypothetical protein
LLKSKPPSKNCPPAEFGELLAWIEEYQAMAGASQALFAVYDEEEKNRAEG